MRDYNLVVPADCVASNTEEENRYALQQIERVLKADITPSAGLDLDRLVGEASRAPRARDASGARSAHRRPRIDPSARTTMTMTAIAIRISTNLVMVIGPQSQRRTRAQYASYFRAERRGQVALLAADDQPLQRDERRGRSTSGQATSNVSASSGVERGEPDVHRVA